MKKFLALMMALMMTFGVAACGGSEEPVEEPANEVEEVAEETMEEVLGDGGADGFVLWECELQELPELAGTWNFCGGYMSDAELTEEEYAASLEMYGGTLQFVLNEDGTAELVQGGGTLYGTYEALDDYSIGVVFDNNGENLPYVCIFIDLDGTTMVAMPDETGETGLYFAK